MKQIFIFTILITFIFVFGCKNPNAPESNTAIQTANQDYIALGNQIVAYTFSTLSSELTKSIKTGGLSNAISYCNINALHLTDSLSKVYNVDIKRTSIKYRNSKNKPTAEEVKILNLYETTMENGEEMKAKIGIDSDSNTFYTPIVIQQGCLKCHGNKSDIAIYDNIVNLYPDDLAIGYKLGDLRGMWSVKFKSE